MADEARRALARQLLLEPFEDHRHWKSRVMEIPAPTGEQFKPWAFHVVYAVTNGLDELQTPYSLTFVEIDHYHNEAQLRNAIGQVRERIELLQMRKIDEWENVRRRPFAGH